MSPRARQFLALAVLALVFGVTAARSGSTLLARNAPEPFPATLAVAVAAAPNIYANEPEVRVQQVIASMNAMWQQAFLTIDDEYELPRIEPRTTRADSECGKGTDGWAGLYCPGEERIVIDVGDHLVRRAAVGDAQSDDLLGYVLAHEVGHHVQAERGLSGFRDQDDVVKAELHAQCLAGVWGRAAGKAVPPVETYVPDADHGDVTTQRHWLETGHASGKPAACNAIWTG